MSPFLLSLFILCSFFPAAVDSIPVEENDNQKRNVGCEDLFVIGAVIDQTSRIGKEQKIAMEMAVHDFSLWTHCSRVVLHFKDSQGNSAKAASSVIDLVNKKQAHAVLGTLAFQEAALVWELDELTRDIPIISLTPSATPSPLLPSQQPPSFIRMSYDMAVQMECLAAIVGHFRWRKVIAIYESSSSFSVDSALVTHLSESLQAVESVVEYHSAFPCINSLLESRNYIEEELKRLRSKNVKVFTVLRASSEFAIFLFKKAKELGMMEKGYAWIVSDDFANLLDSVDSSIIVDNMEGVIGFKMKYLDTTNSFREFERSFRRKYGSEHPEEEKLSSPSIYALRAYDAAWSIAKAMASSEYKANSITGLTKNILTSNFEGLSGKISFKNGALLQKPVFQVVNVIGKSYREIVLWSFQFGFSSDLVDYDGRKLNIGNGLVGNLGTVYWPGGELTPPKGETFGSTEKPLRIGVPAKGAFNIFVNVTYDHIQNKTSIRGFSIDVFEAAVKMLPYHLPYILIPHYGSYDEMVDMVRNKSLDAAVGDTEIMADRYEIADFSQPYMESGLVMVVTVKPDVTKTRLIVLKAFTLKMWILIASMSLATGVVIWLNEHVDKNPEFCGPFPQQIGSVLWFSVTVLSFSHRESIKHNLSRLLLSTWLFVTVVITACFTAAITTMMTVPTIEPSIGHVDDLLRMNAQVGCNGNSFIVRFLIDVLHFKPENVRKIDSIRDYPQAFERGDIKAAFFVAPHAKVFLAEYCSGYTEAGKSFKLGGFGFVFPKGSHLAIDISEAILKVTQSGAINQLEKQLPSFSTCPSSKGAQDTTRRIGTEPFFWLFLISAVLLAVTFLRSVARILGSKKSIYETIQDSLIKRRIYSWASLLLIQPWMKFPSKFLKKSIFNKSHNEMNIPPNERLKTIELTATP